MSWLQWDNRAIAVAGLIVACGGVSRQEPSGGSGKAGTGGDGLTAGVSGTSGAAGDGSGAGGLSGSGGISAGPTGGSSTGADGGAATLPPCLQPRDAGPCDAAMERFAFDPETLNCVPFVYGGCQGNENRFEILSACEVACVTTLPADCEGKSFRGFDCPCTADAQCDGACSSVIYEEGGSCGPSSVGYCTPIGEADCFCRLRGERGCGA